MPYQVTLRPKDTASTYCRLGARRPLLPSVPIARKKALHYLTLDIIGTPTRPGDKAGDLSLDLFMIGVHGKPLHARLSSSFSRKRGGRGRGVRTQAGHLSPHEEFRAVAVTAPRTEIFDLPLSECEWRPAPVSAVRSRPVVRKASRIRSSRSAVVVASVHQPRRSRGNVLNNSAGRSPGTKRRERSRLMTGLASAGRSACIGTRFRRVGSAFHDGRSRCRHPAATGFPGIRQLPCGRAACPR
jgi:hypothetical protein